jgi:hypothetical protein
MTFVRDMLSRPWLPRIRHNVQLPRRVAYYPSPVNWRDEVIYFLMVDRFSDGQEDTRPLLDRRYLAAARSALPNGDPWRWDRWAPSGSERFQGGTLRRVISKLSYLQRPGITTLWLSPSASSASTSIPITATSFRIFTMSIRILAHAGTWSILCRDP